MFEDRKWLPILLISPVNGLLVLLIAVPSVYIIWLSLNQSTFGSETTFVGLANYAQIFADPIFWRSTINTFIVVNVVVYTELALALLLALALNTDFIGKGLVFSILIAPYAVTEVSAVVMWRYLFETDIGMFNMLLQSFAGVQLNWVRNPAHGLTLISILSIWIHLPFTLIILYSAISTVPLDLKNAARVEGATEWQVFRTVTMRFIMPAVLVALMFRYIFATRLFAEAWLLTEGGPARLTEVLGIYLYRAAFRYHDFGAAAATGLAMQMLSLLVASFYLYKLYKRMRADG
jgi:multiple sugar transport system permease protein